MFKVIYKENVHIVYDVKIERFIWARNGEGNNENVVIYLKKHTAKITGYIIQCFALSFPRSWKVEGSLDSVNWIFFL